jgi:hypothetical protein
MRRPCARTRTRGRFVSTLGGYCLAAEMSRRSCSVVVTLVAAALSIVTACTASEPIRGGAPAPGSGDGGSGVGTAGASAGSTGSAGTAGAGSSTGAAGGGPAAGSAGSAGASGAGAGVGTGVAGKTGSGTAGTGAAGNKVDAGAGGSSTDAAATDGPVLTYSGLIGNMLIQNCGGCHFASPGVNIQGGFSFSYENVTGVITSGNKNCSALDASKRRVVPGKPENSLIYIKANVGTPPSGCGGHMPFSGGQLGPQVLATLHDWILQGAKP